MVLYARCATHIEQIFLIMKKLLLLLYLLAFDAIAAPAPEMKARATVRRMIVDFKGAGTFRTTACPRIPTEKWARFLFFNEPVKHSLRFAPNCDVHGDLVITRGQFPIKLRIRNAHGVERVKALVTTDVDPDIFKGKVVIRATASQASAETRATNELLGFSVHYEIVTGLDARLKENRGGTVRVSRYLEKPLIITERFQLN